MEERIIQFRVGVMVVSTFFIALILFLTFNEKNPLEVIFGRSDLEVQIQFPSAPGISVNTPVRKSGLLVGRVTKVAFDDQGNVLVTANLESDKKVYRDEQCRIKSTLLGDAIIEFAAVQGVPGKKILLKNGDKIKGVVIDSPLELLTNMQSDITAAVNSVEKAGDGVAILADKLNAVLGDDPEQFDRLVRKTELAMDNFSTTMGAIEEIIGDDEIKQNLKKTLRDMPEVLVSAKNTMEALQRSSGLLDKNLENLTGLTEPLGQYGDEIVDRVNSSVKQLDSLLEQFAIFGKSINESDGTVAKLLNDKELYDNLNRTAVTINEAAKKLRPILDDVRVFTDKMARDPSRVGVRGVFRQPSGIK